MQYGLSGRFPRLNRLVPGLHCIRPGPAEVAFLEHVLRIRQQGPGPLVAGRGIDFRPGHPCSLYGLARLAHFLNRRYRAGEQLGQQQTKCKQDSRLCRGRLYFGETRIP